MSLDLQETEFPKAPLRKARIICNILDTEYEVIKNVVVETLSWRISENENDDWDITWTDNYITTDKLSKMKAYQKINHFPGMHGICKKNYLAWNLNKMFKLFPNEYNYFPKTWVLPGDYIDFKQHINKKKIFIVKPEASSQGRGIFLIKRLEDINISERYVVQEYLSEPCLIEGLKFDLRIYVLVTGCNPLRVFLHEDGLTRLATEVYSNPNNANFNDLCMHLTNYAINKNNPKFQFNSDSNVDNIGHKRSLKSTYEYLKTQGKDIEELKGKIEDIILKTLCSVQPSVAHVYKTCQPEDFTNSMCFELLGFDIIIDSNLNPVLLEVNHSPSFSTDSPLDWKIKHRLIRESLMLLGSRVRDRKNYYQNKKNEVQRRTFSCKANKETREEKMEKAREAIERREKWENSHLGGFKKLYPAENREKYDTYLSAANQLWSDISGHFPKKKPEEIHKQPSQVKSISKPKPTSSAPKRPLTLSATSLQKLANLQQNPPPEGPEDMADSIDYDNEAIKKILRLYKITPSTGDVKDLVYYKHIEEILRDRRLAISMLRGAELSNKPLKNLKVVKKTEISQGNYVIPKTFDFSPKFTQAHPRGSDCKPNRNIRELNNITV
ncbi:hypothetical protein SteCoe_22198 [Stentor coeruleus]|uniref:Tubulin--tyrosine ligase-like protein 9 n=1 Tax=Stentor coeruleus TaxID=5963 RepID=A0A1R2BMU7_9CILI|nr:hypothetical protein SteCoe_22198 [Stentor coeruleus]